MSLHQAKSNTVGEGSPLPKISEIDFVLDRGKSFILQCLSFAIYNRLFREGKPLPYGVIVNYCIDITHRQIKI